MSPHLAGPLRDDEMVDLVLSHGGQGSHQRRGIATRLVRIAVQEARAAGCEWLHVDFRDDLGAFYVGACGFRTTPAGLIHLAGRDD